MTTKVKTAGVLQKNAMVVGPPPLESGDRLTRYEFERRYNAMPHVKKAELLEGVVYVPSPVRASHGSAQGQIVGWAGTYCASTPGVELADNTTVRLDPDNEPQPDALLRLEPAAGGRSHIGEDDYVEGTPELIVEIAGSSAAYDMHDKKHAYRRNGVQEYLVWQVYEKQIDWWELNEGEYVPLDADEAGVMRSKVFPGLWLDTPALIEGQLDKVLETLRKGLESDEHTAFVARLAASERSSP